MNRQDFQQGVADYDMARVSTSLSQEEETAPTAGSPERAEPINPPETEKTEVAGPFSGLGKKVVKSLIGEEREQLMNKSSRELVRNRPKPPETPSADAVDQVLKDFEAFKKKGMPSFLDVQDPENIDALVEAASKADFPDTRSWKEIQKRTSTVNRVMKELRPITEGRQTGPLSDVQLHGVSRIVSTAFEDVERLVAKVASG